MKTPPQPKKKTMYMHTINGKPASFWKGSICYISSLGNTWATLCDSLDEIKRQQRISKKTWKEESYMGPIEFKYGYVRILV